MPALNIETPVVAIESETVEVVDDSNSENDFIVMISELSVAEIKAFVSAGKLDAESVIAAELQGKNRASILKLAE